MERASIPSLASASPWQRRLVAICFEQLGQRGDAHTLSCRHKRMTMKTLALFLWLFVAPVVIAQNLVPNPSFEYLTECPDDYGQVGRAIGWTGSLSSPDLFAFCGAATEVQTPHNGAGFQDPFQGQNYAGIWTYAGCTEDVGCDHEIIQAMLTEPLTIGLTYHVSLRVSCTTSFPSSSALFGLASNRLGALLRTQPVGDPNEWWPFPNQAHLYAEQLITDTAIWTEIEGDVLADSAYAYLSIGNFFSDALTDTIGILPPGVGVQASYYYIDALCIVEVGGDCSLPTGKPEPESLSGPTCAFDPITGSLVLNGGRRSAGPVILSLFDLHGRAILRCPLDFSESPSACPVGELADGIYLINIRQGLFEWHQKIFLSSNPY